LNLQQFLREVERQPAWTRGGERAPHKRLAILFALGRALAGRRLAKFAEAERPLRELLERFGAVRAQQHPEQPVWRLARRGEESVSWWELVGADEVPSDSAGNPSIVAMRAHLSFGLSQACAAHFQSRPEEAWLAAHGIAASIVPETMRDELLSATLGDGIADQIDSGTHPESELVVRELAPTWRVVRDPRFSARVLRAYEERCVVCEVAPRHRARLFGIEAAHIRWAAAQGPDEVWNGLSMCRMHHAGLDRGAFTLDENLRVRVASQLARDERTRALFHAYDGREIRPPANASDAPRPDMLRWHHREVFRDPAALSG